MSQVQKNRFNYQVAPSGMPTVEKDRRYADAWVASSVPRPAVTHIAHVPEMELPNLVLQWALPSQAPSRLPEDVQVFTRAVKDVIAAAHDEIITADEADAVIGLLAEQFAARRANLALSRLGGIIPHHIT